ncbi:hypothetical protein GPECTOR_7g1323 [Gonium pectorale]|uniref:Uncharacterized protein n=1 Tax=Gonium pectorale TaxID=33097 RepID=A0A150GU89_GONPE|nr:hypothetical protein GPECTOR_7g1323 [Gonium pectorale]|eukprot:KXZ53425.1 hypothetical protein GPECTOR_7g1323 [Gonium pectorale]
MAPQLAKEDSRVTIAGLEPEASISDEESARDVSIRKNLGAFDAITDLIAEAALNKASLMTPRQAAGELVKLLAMPAGQRRAATYRDLTELGRNLELPPWHGSDRRQLYVWYHCCHRLRLVELEAGQSLTKEGELGDSAYWLLSVLFALKQPAVLPDIRS